MDSMKESLCLASFLLSFCFSILLLLATKQTSKQLALLLLFDERVRAGENLSGAEVFNNSLWLV